MVKVVSFGCRINSYESEIFKEKLQKYDNLVVVNTCAVTAEAERQCRQAIRRLKKENPAAKIVVTGCAAQVSTELFSFSGYDAYMITGFEGRERAFVEIQQGCNHRCTYCIVPYARGANRSVPEEKIMAQIALLLQQGFKEICLTGIDACSYEPSFSGLVAAVLKRFPDLPSLQFGSLDPAAINDEFIELVRNYPNIYPHFHFSVQSGDNLILKRMGRRHSREDVISLCGRLREVRPECTFGADFICGFPTETDENFTNTLKLVEEAGIDKLHVFPYSERPGTPAARMPQVPVHIRRERAEKLRNLRKEDK